MTRMIYTKDKTLAHGDVLADDKPDVTGARRPDLWHVVYDQPHVDGARKTRASWHEVLFRL